MFIFKTKFRQLFLLVFVTLSFNLSAFTPKISCSKKSLPLFNMTGQHCQNIHNQNPNDPIILEMKRISRENIKNLPDEVYFGSMAMQENQDLKELKRYNIYNFFFEGIAIEAGFAVYETMDSVSIFPSFNEIGPYLSRVEFSWEEEDPETKIIKQYKKNVRVSANIVESSDKIDQNDTQIKEIWYEDNENRNYENKGAIEGGNMRVGPNNSILILPDNHQFKVD